MKKRVLCSILAASMAAAALVSCSGGGESSTASTDSSTPASDSTASAESGSSEESSETAAWTPNFDEEPYTVHFQYCVAAEGTGLDGVQEAVNELALEEINMQVDLIPQTMGTWTQNLSMMLAANEPLDLFLNGSGNFGTFIESGYMLDWNDYLQYVPDVLEGMGEDAYSANVGGFLAGFSQMKERGYQGGLVARKDIMDELGLSPDDFTVDINDIDSFQQLDDLFAAVKEAHPDMVAVGGSGVASFGGNFADNLGDNFGMLLNYGQDLEVVNYFETDQYRDLCEIARRWFQAGYESADAATTTDSGETLMKAGNLFSYLTNVKPNTDVEKLAQTGYEVYVIPIQQEVMSTSMSINAIVYSLANASEDPVKAAAFYNWCYQSGEFQDLINWGVEGVDWEEKEDGTAGYPEGVDASSVSYHQDFGWAYPNQFAGHPWEGNDVDVWEQYEEYNAGLLRSKAYGFTYDSTPVANELAACTSVYDQYDNDLNFGTIDTESGIQQLNDALYGAGLQTIMDEKQTQLDAWLAENGEGAEG